MKQLRKKGQGAMGIVTLAVGIIIGLYLVGSIYNSTSGMTGLPASSTQAMADVMDYSSTGMTLLAVAIIVGAAMFVLSIMGSK
jgi:hypothetical protein